MFGKKGATGWDALALVVELLFFSNFGVSGPRLDPIGLHSGSIWAPFRCPLGSILAPFGLHMLPSTGWWGYAKREEFQRKIND